MMFYMKFSGNKGESCSNIAPACTHSVKELLQASLIMGVGDSEDQAEERRHMKARINRQQSKSLLGLVRKQKKKRSKRHILPSLSSMPPLFRPDYMASELACRTCDERSAICAVFSVGKASTSNIRSLGDLKIIFQAPQLDVGLSHLLRDLLES